MTPLEKASACAVGDDWPRCGIPSISAAGFKRGPEDFCVNEVLGFAPDGEGEFELCRLEKRERNTDEVAQMLARYCGVSPRSVSWSGLKDRQSVSRQWFSIHLPGKASPDWQAFSAPGLRLLEAARHRRKLRIGSHQANAFTIRLRSVVADRTTVEEQLDGIARAGVPNYFGPQRFGRGASNIDRALSLFGSGKRPRRGQSMLLSAARSLLFNEVLARRVVDGSWQQALPGDLWMFDGSGSRFGPEEPDEDIRRRLDEGVIHASGPMWGRGRLGTESDVAALERRVAAELAEVSSGLEKAGLKMDRRALRLLPAELKWSWDGQDLELQFQLGIGAFATSVIREVMDLP